MKLSDEDKRRTYKTVRSFMQKRRYAQSKGVTKGALPKPVTYNELINAYENNPSGLNKRLNSLQRFSTRGETFKTEGGVTLTKKIASYKNKEIRQGEAYQVERYDRLKYNKSSTAKDYRKTKVNYLKDKTIENVKYSQLPTINYSIETPEQIKNRKKLAVENFMKAINVGLEDDNVVSTNPMIRNRIERYLKNFTEDEIADLLTGNSTVRALMDYYRGEDPEQPLEFLGESWEDLLYQFYEDLPNIAKGIYRKRRQDGKEN